MAKIEKRVNKDSSLSYRVMIRKKNLDISKTFHTEEDAKLYVFYKERLIDNMENFEIPLKERLTFENLYEIKMSNSNDLSTRSRYDLKISFEYISKNMDIKKFVDQISLDDWIECAKKLLDSDVYRGAKTESAKRKMSAATLRKIIAYASSIYSCAQENGVDIENIPAKLLKGFVANLLKK